MAVHEIHKPKKKKNPKPKYKESLEFCYSSLHKATMTFVFKEPAQYQFTNWHVSFWVPNGSNELVKFINLSGIWLTLLREKKVPAPYFRVIIKNNNQTKKTDSLDA